MTDAELRPPPRPLRVLAARRGGTDRAAEVEPGRADDLLRGRASRDAGRRRHRPRVDVRGPAVLRGRPGRRRQADHRRRGLRGPRLAVRPEPGRERGEVLPPDPPGRERDRLPQPPEARDATRTSRASTTGRAWTSSCWPSTPRACICLSGCLSSEIGVALLAGQDDRARRGRRRVPRHLRGRQLLHRGPGSRARPTSARSCRRQFELGATSSASRSWRRTTCTTR